MPRRPLSDADHRDLVETVLGFLTKQRFAQDDRVKMAGVLFVTVVRGLRKAKRRPAIEAMLRGLAATFADEMRELVGEEMNKLMGQALLADLGEDDTRH
jgi:hypothetical protein